MSFYDLPQLNVNKDQTHTTTPSPLEKLPHLVQRLIVDYLEIDDYLQLRETNAYWADWGRDRKYLQYQMKRLGPKVTLSPENSFEQNFGIFVRSCRQTDRINKQLQRGPVVVNDFYPGPEPIKTLAWAPSETGFLASGTGAGSFTLHKTRGSGYPHLHLDQLLLGEVSGATCAAINRLGALVVGLSSGEAFVIAAAEDKKTEPDLFSAHAASIKDITFADDEEHFITSSYDHTAKIWKVGDLRSGGHILSGHLASVVSAKISPFYKQAATASEDATVRLWNFGGINPFCTDVLMHPAAVSCVVYSPDGRSVATACIDGVARIWDTRRTENPVRVFADLGSILRTLVYSSDGQYLITGSTCGVARIIDVSSKKSPPFGGIKLEFPINALSFSADGRFLAMATDGGGFQIFDFDPRPPVPLGLSINRQKSLLKASMAARATHVWLFAKDVWLNYIATIS